MTPIRVQAETLQAHPICLRQFRAGLGLEVASLNTWAVHLTKGGTRSGTIAKEERLTSIQITDVILPRILQHFATERYVVRSFTGSFDSNNKIFTHKKKNRDSETNKLTPASYDVLRKPRLLVALSLISLPRTPPLRVSLPHLDVRSYAKVASCKHLLSPEACGGIMQSCISNCWAREDKQSAHL